MSVSATIYCWSSIWDIGLGGWSKPLGFVALIISVILKRALSRNDKELGTSTLNHLFFPHDQPFYQTSAGYFGFAVGNVPGGRLLLLEPSVFSLLCLATALSPDGRPPKDHGQCMVSELRSIRGQFRVKPSWGTLGEGLWSNDINFIQVILSEVLIISKRILRGHRCWYMVIQAPLAFGGRAVHPRNWEEPGSVQRISSIRNSIQVVPARSWTLGLYHRY